MEEENSFHSLAGKTVRQPESKPAVIADEWDQWVLARIAKHQTLVAEGLKESGMKEPIPGLAGMVENGKFFDCAPYGKCWQPNPVAQQALSNASEPPALAGAAWQPVQTPATRGAPPSSGSSSNGRVLVNQTLLSRCPLQTWQMTRDAQGNLSGQVLDYGPCFAGSWNYSDDPCLRTRWTTPNSYLFNCPPGYGTWVAGRRHRHECHYVKEKGHQIGIVPRHPLDKSGQRPLNARNGIMVLGLGKGKVSASVVAPPARGLQIESREPYTSVRGIEKAALQSAPHVEQPEIQAKLATQILPPGILTGAHASSLKSVTAVLFDYKSGNFVGKTGANGAGHSIVMAHAGGEGSHGGFGGGGGGSAHGGGSGGGSVGGGGDHSGGGGSSSSASSGGGGHH
jgi:hypothetical protein